MLVLGHFHSNFAYIFITQFTFFLNKDSHIKESMYVNPPPKKRDFFVIFFIFCVFGKIPIEQIQTPEGKALPLL